MTAPRNRIKEVREARGLSLNDLAERVGADHTTVWKLERGKRRLTAEWLSRLSKALDVPAPSLVPDWANLPTATLANDVPPLPEREDMPRDVPVYGTARGGPEGTFLLQRGEAVDYVRRPPGIAKARDAFALYVEGDSMVPWRRAGQLVFVNPRRPAAVGDHVVVVLQDGEDGSMPALLKRLERRTAEKLVLSQYNPEIEIEIPTSRVAQIWRVMELEELLGV
ncbi:repressor [Caldovatus sediminis]|uniref:Repressor n=2 Tax=Caldovatus sediminis TaxID=2041189 RepID=A0A8J3EEF6_9PROT|nr:repressor [Caldovatus sediminis]